MLRWLALFLTLSVGLFAAEVSSSISLSNGVHLSIETSFGQPTGTQVIKADMAPASGDSFYRLFRDRNDLVVYGYELMVSRDGEEFRLIVKPLLGAFARRFPNADGGKPTPTVSEERVLASMHSGDRTSFEVFHNEGSGIKVTDTIELQLDTPSASSRRGEAIRFSGLKVYLNGGLASAPTKAVVSGPYAMFYLPSRGGYFFSTQPVTDRSFLQVGRVDKNRVEFVIDNERLECISDSQILAGSERGQVWVYHDSGYKPKGNWTTPLDTASNAPEIPAFFAAAADSLHWWLP